MSAQKGKQIFNTLVYPLNASRLQTFASDARLIGDNVHMLRMGIREMKEPFYLARMLVSDEVKSRTKMTQVTMCLW